MKHTLAHGLLHGYQRLGDLVAAWTRLNYEGPARLPAGPALLVANHGFGTIYDMNGLILARLLRDHRPAGDTPITILSHEAAWRIGLGPFVEPAGLVKASRDNALSALADGHLVVVLPGGDLDAAKNFRNRNTVVFGDRHGFADIAMQANVPIIPIVISGAGETALVLADGQRLARWFALDRLFRLKTCPISLSLPWGVSVGVAGMAVPYFPLPAKMRVRVLNPLRAGPNEAAACFAKRVHIAMNTALGEMTRGRVPFLGLRYRRSGPKRAAPDS